MKLYSVFFLIFCSTSLSTMNNDAVLPDDMINSIVSLICPRLNLPMYDKYLIRYKDEAECNDIKKNLPLIGREIISLRCICKHINAYIAENIISLLCLDKTHMDAFLIRSLQANVPYFVTCALAHGADSNAIDKARGFTALLYAIENNSHQACTLLISNKADVNLKMKYPEALGYSYKSHRNWPIHMAIKKGDAQLVTLFAQAGAKLNVIINDGVSSFTLLSTAVNRNDPDIVKALLTLGTDTDYYNKDIETALAKAKAYGKTVTEFEDAIRKDPEELHKNTQIIYLLEQVQKQRQQSQLNQEMMDIC